MATPPVQISLAVESLVHLKAVLDGLLQGASGNVSVNPNVRDLVDGVYHVLAGGKVTVNVIQHGNQAQFRAYQAMEADSLKSSNAFNKGHPHPITVDI